MTLSGTLENRGVRQQLMGTCFVERIGESQHVKKKRKLIFLINLTVYFNIRK